MDSNVDENVKQSQVPNDHMVLDQNMQRLEELRCQLCREVLIEALEISCCSHKYCSYCFDEYMDDISETTKNTMNNPLCPICFMMIHNEPRACPDIDQEIDDIYSKFSLGKRSSRNKKKDERQVQNELRMKRKVEKAYRIQMVRDQQHTASFTKKENDKENQENGIPNANGDNADVPPESIVLNDTITIHRRRVIDINSQQQEMPSSRTDNSNDTSEDEDGSGGEHNNTPSFYEFHVPDHQHFSHYYHYPYSGAYQQEPSNSYPTFPYWCHHQCPYFTASLSQLENDSSSTAPFEEPTHEDEYISEFDANARHNNDYNGENGFWSGAQFHRRVEDPQNHWDVFLDNEGDTFEDSDVSSQNDVFNPEEMHQNYNLFQTYAGACAPNWSDWDLTNPNNPTIQQINVSISFQGEQEENISRNSLDQSNFNADLSEIVHGLTCNCQSGTNSVYDNDHIQSGPERTLDQEMRGETNN